MLAKCFTSPFCKHGPIAKRIAPAEPLFASICRALLNLSELERVVDTVCLDHTARHVTAPTLTVCLEKRLAETKLVEQRLDVDELLRHSGGDTELAQKLSLRQLGHPISM